MSRAKTCPPTQPLTPSAATGSRCGARVYRGARRERFEQRPRHALAHRGVEHRRALPHCSDARAAGERRRKQPEGPGAARRPSLNLCSVRCVEPAADHDNPQGSAGSPRSIGSVCEVEDILDRTQPRN